MMLLTWNHSRSVSVQAMDDQHGILIDLLNELRLAMLSDASRKQINDLLKQLIAFMHMHFVSGESLMEQYQFPGLARHRAEHQSLIKKIQEETWNLRHGQPVEMRPLLNFLREWFVQHIETADQEYGEWLNTHGIQ